MSDIPGLSVRATNTLARGIRWEYGTPVPDQQIRRLSDQDLRAMPGLGTKTLREIRQVFPYDPAPAPLELADPYDYFLARLSA
jgi:hypothetical protein